MTHRPLLFWLDRVDSLTGIAGLQQKVSETIRSNVYITNSGMLNPAMLRHALEATTIDRLIFSTDYPFHQPNKAAIDEFLAALPSDADRAKFTHRNARKLLLGDG